MSDSESGLPITRSKITQLAFTPRGLKDWHSAFNALERAKKAEAQRGTIWGRSALPRARGTANSCPRI